MCALAGVVLILGLDFGLHDKPPHLSRVVFGGGLLVFVCLHHGRDGIPLVLLFGVLQFRLPGAQRPVGLIHHTAVEPVHLLLDTLFSGLVVPLAIGGLGIGLRVREVIHHTLIGLCHFGRQAAVLLFHVSEQRVRRFNAADLAFCHFFCHCGGVSPLCKGFIHINAALGEVIQVFLRGFVCHPHAGQTGDQHAVVAFIEGQSRRGVRQGGQHAERPVCTERLYQRLCVSGDLVVCVIGQGSHFLHLVQIVFRRLVGTQQGGKGHLLLFPVPGNSRSGSNIRFHLALLVFHRLLDIRLERLVFSLKICSRAGHKPGYRAHTGADGGTNPRGNHASNGRAGTRSAQSAGKQVAYTASPGGTHQRTGPLTCHIASQIPRAGFTQSREHPIDAQTSRGAGCRPVFRFRHGVGSVQHILFGLSGLPAQ